MALVLLYGQAVRTACFGMKQADSREGSISYLGGASGMFFANVAQYNVLGTGAGNEYNTLITVTANELGPTFNRTLEQAFYADEPLWGSFGTAASDVDGILAFAATEGGVKVARVKPESYSDLSQVHKLSPILFKQLVLTDQVYVLEREQLGGRSSQYR